MTITAKDAEVVMAQGRWSVVSVVHTPECEPTPNSFTRYFKDEDEALANLTNDGLYERIEKWQRSFVKRYQNGEGQYYNDAASGLALALQEIDRDRYDRTGSDVWNTP